MREIQTIAESRKRGRSIKTDTEIFRQHGFFKTALQTAKNVNQVVEYECEGCGLLNPEKEKEGVLNSNQKIKLNRKGNAYVSDGCTNIFVWNFIRRT